MQLDIYQAETAAHAVKQDLILQEARQNLVRAGSLSALEFSGAVHALQRKKLKYGMVTMCVGMGQGAAGILERV